MTACGYGDSFWFLRQKDLPKPGSNKIQRALIGNDNRAVARRHQFPLFIAYHQPYQISARFDIEAGFYGDPGAIETFERGSRAASFPEFSRHR